MRAWWVAWGPAAAWAAVLFLFSAQATLPLEMSSGRDKIVHFVAYLLLGALLAWGAERSTITLTVAIGLGVLYGLLDEFHQSFVPGRSAELADWIADALGTAAGVLLYRHFWGLRDEDDSEDAGAAIETRST